MGEASFADLLARLRCGEEEAATALFERYARRLVALAQRRLSGRLRAKLDAEDVVQSAFKSFFARASEGDFELTSWDGLWSLLVVITLRKCGKQIEHFRAARRDIGKESGQADDSAASWAAVARDPTPEEAAMLAETLAQMLQALSARERRVFELRLQGYTAPEISVQVQRSEHTVNWILKRIRKRLCRVRDHPEEV
jgi:RNA polymerase sigma-70 factor (ECF subfamily)